MDLVKSDLDLIILSQIRAQRDVVSSRVSEKTHRPSYSMHGKQIRFENISLLS